MNESYFTPYSEMSVVSNAGSRSADHHRKNLPISYSVAGVFSL